MSNLVKQYFVIDSNEPARIIDSNAKLEAKFGQINFEKQRINQVFPSFDEDEAYNMNSGEFKGESPVFLENDESLENESEEYPDNEFAEGLTPSKVVAPVEEPVLDAEAIIEEANAQAQEILADAQEKADMILEDAHIKAKQIYEEKKHQGYSDGIQNSEEEINSAKEEYEKEYLDLKTKLEQDFAIRNDTLESDLIDAIIAVFNNVFHIQFDDKKEILLYLVKNTISKVEVGKEFRIHVAQNNYKFMLSRIDEIRERIGNDVEIEIVNDANLESADCQIETSFGVFDCGIDMELNNLYKAIRCLCNK